MSTQRINEELTTRAGYDHIKFLSSTQNVIYTALIDENGAFRGISNNIKPLALERRAEFSHEADVYEAATRQGGKTLIDVLNNHDGMLAKWQHDYVVSTLADLSNEFDNGTITSVTATNESLRPEEQSVYGAPYDLNQILAEANRENVQVYFAKDRFGVPNSELGNYLYALPAGQELPSDTDEEVLLALAAQYGSANGVTVASLENYAAGFLLSNVYKTAFDLYDKGDLNIIDINGNPLQLQPAQESESASSQADSMLEAIQPTDPSIVAAAVNAMKAENDNKSEEDQDQIDVSDLLAEDDTPAPDDVEHAEAPASESEPEPIDLDEIGAAFASTEEPTDNTSEHPVVPTIAPVDLPENGYEPPEDTADEQGEKNEDNASGGSLDEEPQELVDNPDYNDETDSPVIAGEEDIVPEKVNALIEAVREAQEYARRIKEENEDLQNQVSSLTQRSVDEINESRNEIDAQKHDYESQRESLQSQISELKQQLGDVIMKEQDLNSHYEEVDHELEEAHHRDELLAKIHENEVSISKLQAAAVEN